MTNVREAERVGPLALDDADGIEGLRNALDRADYRIEQIEPPASATRSQRARERGLDPDRLAAAALPVVQRLFELGYLERQSSSASR